MIIEFDPAKNARNIAECGLSFERAVDFDFKTAKVWQDMRSNTLNRAYSAQSVTCAGVLRYPRRHSCHQLS